MVEGEDVNFQEISEELFNDTPGVGDLALDLYCYALDPVEAAFVKPTGKAAIA